MTSQKTFFACQHVEYCILVEHDEKPPQLKFGGTWFMGPEIWPHEYAIAPIKISVNWTGS